MGNNNKSIFIGNQKGKRVLVFNRVLYLQKIIRSLQALPTCPNLNYFWNFGSLLGWCLVLQLITGLCLACFYTPREMRAFDSVFYIVKNVQIGWFFRSLHSNGASLFFIGIYFHMGRALYYGSYRSGHLWRSGCMLFVFLMFIAFTGYVLPWGQISYWGATVITSLFRAIPKIGSYIVEILWGGGSVCGATLRRFFVLHFISPFILLILVLLHVRILHNKGSRNPLGIDRYRGSISFYPSYIYKDLFGIFVWTGLLLLVRMSYTGLFEDPQNYFPADSIRTPEHIQPEWYFLFAYAILRAFPTKGTGVLALAGSVAILFIIPDISFIKYSYLAQNNPLSKFYFLCFALDFLLLRYLGACPARWPYVEISIYASIFYFTYFFTISLPDALWFWMTGIKKSINTWRLSFEELK